MIKVTKEIIYSYTCDSCNNWWSYATTEAYTPKVLTCPHCGIISDIKENGD